MAMSFNFVLSNNTNGYNTGLESDSETSLLSDTNMNDSSILTATSDYNNSCVDAFGGKDLFGTCDISNMSEAAFVAESSAETAGSVACNSAETMGSVACGSTETAGSVACGSDSGSSCGGSSFSSFC